MRQVSILGPLLFDIFLCDSSLFLHDIPIANYADDNNSRCTGLKIPNVLIKLNNVAEKLLQRFKDNIKIGNGTFSNSKFEKLLGVKVIY